MAIRINERLLEEKLAAVEKARTWSPRTIAKLEALLRAPDDYTLFRVNPIAFAAEKGVPENEAIDLFLHATKCGLFETDWILLCMSCGDVVESFGTLKMLDSHYRCDICHSDYDASADEQIEVAFTVARTVRELSFHRPETLSAEDFFLKYRFHRSARLPDGRRYVEGVRQISRFMDYVEPGQTKSVEFDIGPDALGLSDVLLEADAVVPVAATPAQGTQRFHVKVRQRGFDLPAVPLMTGRIVLELENISTKRGAILAAHYPTGFMGNHAAPKYDPFLSANRLFSNQTFRTLFRAETIGGTEGIKVNDLTVLFSDLKGSTSLYDRIGDLKAFSLVHRHFEDMGRAISNSNGAIVKTIGDAVMASFTCPKDAVRAALGMLEEIGRVNAERGSKDLVLKIGVHKGASIAVTLNDRLDYFGQNINIAARVQGLADAEEIFLTREVYEGAGVKDLLGGRTVEPVTCTLKGIEKEFQVFKVKAQGKVEAAA